MSNRFLMKPLAAAILVGLAASGPLYANPVIQEETHVLPGRQITPREEAVISSSAMKALRHITKARTALQGDKPDAETAGGQLDQSEKLLDIIEAALPTSRIQDRVWTAKNELEYQNTEEVAPDLIPIYGSFDELVDYLPETQAKPDSGQGTKEKPQAGPMASTDQLEEVDDALVYVEADLPLSHTRFLVTKAQSALAAGDTKAAEQALKSAEENVVLVSVSYRAPLLRAKAALYRAGEEYQSGDKDLAKADLNRAVEYLQQAAESTDEVTRTAAGDLVTDVRGLDAEIDSGGEGFSAKFERAWERVKAVSERSAEYVSTGWQRLRSQGVAKQDLVDAKLHLAYARIDHLNTNDDAAARVDLAEAKGYINAAAKQLRAEHKTEVEKLSDAVAGLETALESGNAAHADALAFGRVESQLTTMIHRL